MPTHKHACITWHYIFFRTVPTPPADQPGSPLAAIFEEYTRCPQHRSLILTLCSILQTITVQCPGALVWHNLGEGKTNSPLYGSPLDLLPCPPSCLPLPFGADSQEVNWEVIKYSSLPRSRTQNLFVLLLQTIVAVTMTRWNCHHVAMPFRACNATA